jgi:hypothetical protein
MRHGSRPFWRGVPGTFQAGRPSFTSKHPVGGEAVARMTPSSRSNVEIEPLTASHDRQKTRQKNTPSDPGRKAQGDRVFLRERITATSA